jgi:hypothetical protein
MDYGKLLSRTWKLIWEHKFLILLGILVALSSGGSTGSISSGSGSLPRADEEWRPRMPQDWQWSPDRPMRDLGLPVLPMLVILFLVAIATIIALAVWVVSTLARGALIAGASAVDSGSVTSFGETFAIAWRKGWTLLGIGILPALPALFLLLVALGGTGAYLGWEQVVHGLDPFIGPRNVWLILGSLTCVALPLVLALNLLRTFANRACMLEGRGVFPAYGRGFSVLVDNFGSALLLFLIQVAIGIALGLVLLLPALCCLFWPLLILVQGASAAFFSTMWTLAWRQWAGPTPADDLESRAFKNAETQE